MNPRSGKIQGLTQGSMKALSLALIQGELIPRTGLLLTHMGLTYTPELQKHKQPRNVRGKEMNLWLGRKLKSSPRSRSRGLVGLY